METGAPAEPYPRLFARFLRFGALAWGGPVAQIGMLREELVEREGWVTRERFNRTLAVYQALPGPEAHELCVYFGYLARGRLGGLLAGLGFMLPGFLLVLGLAWLYVEAGLTSAALAGAFAGLQPAVAALIVRAAVRIARHALTRPWLWVVGFGSAIAQATDVPFWIPIAAGGVSAALAARGRVALAVVALAAFGVAAATSADPASIAVLTGETATGPAPGSWDLLGSGLRAGLLTFGGAYTAIPFVRRDAVVEGAWMTNGQFLDSLALSGIVPAPLVIFGTFVGYVGAGLPGAFAMTAGIFLPAFAFTMVGRRHLERVVDSPGAHGFLDGVAAAVVGLMAVTAIRLVAAGVPDPAAAVLFVAALAAATWWKARWAVAAIVLGAGVAGLVLDRL